ncbi:Ig-like domain-containing protein [Streptomyces sp. NPDC001380]|uniref:Ig-like domain-containing protein n=1 Tax=Streptomyces sp. NPDC001380 TaxID=3364566 RepID=UPI00367381C3
MGRTKRLAVVMAAVLAAVTAAAGAGRTAAPGAGRTAAGRTAAAAAAADTAVLGATTPGSRTDSGDANYMNATRYVTGASGGTVTSMSVYVGAVSAAPRNQFQVALYSDNANAPGTLIAKSASAALTANSWNTVAVSATVKPNTAYWLAYNTNASSSTANNMTYDSGGRSAYATGGTAFGTWPSGFGNPAYQSVSFAVRATYTVDTTPPPDPGPGSGSGGPILVIASAANPYSRYYGEILTAEGVPYFKVLDIAQVTSTTLAGYDVALLGEMPLTQAQAAMLGDWTTGGGKLVAMRPDKKLAPLLGIADAGAVRSDAYLKIDTSSGPGAGITGATMQYHGAADRYTLDGATAVATLYGDATTATTDPAVTLRGVGSSGGQAAAFTYDLAKSVVQTRQGNIAWAGQQRDSTDGYEAGEMFFGTNGQPDWNNLDKAIIPIADEQQRLLVNLITQMDRPRKPLPRFWYFPRDVKAVVVMTGDDHGIGGTAGRWDGYIAQSPSGCDVAAWQCVRGSSYLYTSGPMTAAQAKAYTDQGFEVGVHVTTDCRPWGAASALSGLYQDQLGAWKAKYPALPGPSSSRTHCVEWDDWATQPKVKKANGIRLDTDYYYYPASFTKNRPGFFNGTGEIMRFADEDGSVIDTYQATTQMTDESGQTYPYTVDTLLDAAYGSQGYYAALTANIHTDFAASAASDAIIASAKAHGVPVVSGRQMLTWLDTRNNSTFTNLAWQNGRLTFDVAGGANGLRGMVPASSAGGSLAGITFGGAPVPYLTDTVKGVQYAFFDAKPGSYTAAYGQDTTPPSVTSTAPADGAKDVALTTAVRVGFDEPVDPATVTGSTVTLRTAAGAAVPAAVAWDAAANAAVLTPARQLTADTAYTLTVQQIKDTAGNAMASPFTAGFTTGGVPLQTLGSTQAGSQLDDGNANHMNGSKVTTGAAAVSLKSMSVYVGSVSAAPADRYQLAVYTDNAGSPGTLVASTATGTLTANTWNTLPVTATLGANTTYWLMYNTNGADGTSNNMRYSAGSAGQGAYSAGGVAFGNWPASFGSSVKAAAAYSLYASY